MSKKIIFTVFAIALIAVVYSLSLINGSTPVVPTNNSVAKTDIIPTENQVLSILAKAGFSPQSSTLKAGQPVTIKFTTKNTFDCTSTVLIKSLGITKNLTPNGETLIEIPAQKAGTALKGTCSMGMYSFDILFA